MSEDKAPAAEPLSEAAYAAAEKIADRYTNFKYLYSEAWESPLGEEIAGIIQEAINPTIRALQAERKRMKGMEAALEAAKEYFDQRADVHHDNPHTPNEEMRLWEEINHALER